MQRLVTPLFIFATVCASVLFVTGILAGFGITVADPGALNATLVAATLSSALVAIVINADMLP